MVWGGGGFVTWCRGTEMKLEVCREVMRRRVPRGLMPAVTRVGILRTQGRSSKTQGICDDNCDSPFRHITIWVVGGERRAFSHVRAFVIWWQCKQSTRALIGSSGKTLWTFAKLRFITKTCFFQSLLLLIIAAVLQFPPGDDDRCYLGHHSLNSDNFPNFHLELFETILPLMCFSCAHRIDIIRLSRIFFFFPAGKQRLCLIILNQPLDEDYLRILWRKGATRLTRWQKIKLSTSASFFNLSLACWILICSSLKHS